MKYILKIMFVILAFNGFGQTNLVPNHSFEELKIGHQDSPTGSGQLEHAKNWKLIGNDPSSNTTDLNSDLPGKYKFGGAPNNAKTGHNFISFGSCEGAQVKLTEKLEPMHWVTVSLWFAPEDQFDRTISIYLCKEKMNDIDCENPVVPHEIYLEADVVAGDPWGNPSSPHFKGNWYHYKSEPILITTEDIEWLLIKQLATYGTTVFVDQVEVNTFDFCEHVCADDQPIEFTNIIPNAMVGNSGVNFFTTIKNATEVEVFVWHLWGGLGYYWHSFDVEGLKDPGYDDFAIVWNGNSTLTGGDFIENKIYPIRIIAKSCGDVYQYDGNIALLEIYNPPAVIYPETQKTDSPNCCPEFELIQNTVYLSDANVSVNDFIHVGAYVAPPPNGPVVVANTANVKYRAGNYIYFEPGGFSVDAGGVFDARIEPCGASPQRHELGPRDYYEELRKNIDTDQNDITSDINSSADHNYFMIFPNPTTDVINIKSNFNAEEYQLYDLQGKMIKKGLITSTETSIDLSRLNEGIYFLQIESETGEVHFKKVIKN